jgi:hypothetical protein
VDAVVKYILNQEEHHKKQIFKEEYLDFLNKFEIEYDSKYLFDWIESNYQVAPTELRKKQNISINSLPLRGIIKLKQQKI